MNKSYNHQNRRGEAGFTLVELSIVLVIIGLIVGGVLVGQNLIKAAEIRATVSQVEKYNAAVNTFKSRYGGLPGDFNKAVRFSLGTGVADGNGNGLLEDDDPTDGPDNFLDELTQFWLQLSASNMIDGTYEVYTTGDNDMTVGTHFPYSKHGIAGVIAYSMDGFNHYHIGVDSSTTDAVGYLDTLVPGDAFNIDNKLDDGVASTGSVRAMDDDALGTSAGGDTCVVDTDPGAGTLDDYDLALSTMACQLRIRMN